ncbi:MAG: hypothetical protein ACRBFS_21600 [Aureispira sp.]
MKDFKLEKKHLIALGVAAVIAIVIFVWGKYTGKKSPNKKKVQVQIDVRDGRDGTTTSYDPTPMVDQLYEALNTWAWRWGDLAQQRCQLLYKLLELSTSAPVDFMAVVYGYEQKHETTLLEDIEACWLYCSNKKGQTRTQIKERIETLSAVIKLTT